jgi:hypothetical protein
MDRSEETDQSLFEKKGDHTTPTPTQLWGPRDTYSGWHLDHLREEENEERVRWVTGNLTQPIRPLDGVVHVPSPVILTHVAKSSVDASLSSDSV